MPEHTPTSLPTTQRIVHLVKRPDGAPVESDFEVVEVALPEVREGQILIKNLFMSLDPSMRIRMHEKVSDYMPPYQLGQPLDGFTVAQVVESKSSGFRPGDYLTHALGWRDYEVVSTAGRGFRDPQKIVVDDVATPQSYLNALGTSGLTAWAGLRRVANLQAGEVVFVSAGAGSVGSMAVQIARILGCEVIASAGSAEKVDYLVNVCGATAAFNYKDGDVRGQLAAAAPRGIDVYFDNVGGDHLEAALDLLNTRGRVALCGSISQYSSTTAVGPRNLFNAIAGGLRLEGFLSRMYHAEMDDFRAEMRTWMAKGLIEQRETVYSGIENAPKAFIDMLAGRSLGKVFVEL